MAIRIELALTSVRAALEAKIAQLKRQLNTNQNQMIKEIIQKDIAEHSKALETLTECK